MPWDTEQQDYVISRLTNVTGTAEGSNLPPRQQGSFRVPFVTGLQLVKTTSYFGGTQFTLIWLEPNDFSKFIDHYSIYVTGLLENNFQPLGPYTVKQSPATIRVQTNAAARIAFYVQTVLKNGMASDILSSPSCTGTTIAATTATSDIPDGTVTRVKIAANTQGAIDCYDASGVPTVLAPGATGTILYSQGVTAIPAYTSTSLVWDAANSRLKALSGLAHKRTTVADTNYTGLVSDYIIAYTSLTAGRTVTLPLGVAGQAWVVKDEAGGATANNITVQMASGNIDGAANKVINANYGVLRIYSDGTNAFTW